MPFFLVASFLVVSGIASLAYQVAWVRLLGLSMGSTRTSISTVLAAFFLGMAVGSYLAERITRNRIQTLYCFGIFNRYQRTDAAAQTAVPRWPARLLSCPGHGTHNAVGTTRRANHSSESTPDDARGCGRTAIE